MQNIVSFNCDVKSYAEHWQQLRPEPPASCPFDGCDSRMYRNGSYPRSVIDYDGTPWDIGVFRFLCSDCRRTVSYLPDFCVPYKQFSVDVIGAVLGAVLLLNLAARAVAATDSIYNKASFSVYCVHNWVRQFRRNGHNLWHIGLARLGIAVVPAPDTEAALFEHLAGFGAVSSAEPASCNLRAAQCRLSSSFPPFGIFRAQLLPGCCT